MHAIGGETVEQVAGLFKSDGYTYGGNVLLINAGTNDCLAGSAEPARRHMESLVNDILENGRVGNEYRTTVILSTLLPHANAAKNQCHKQVKLGHEIIVSQLAQQGKPIVLADMSPDIGPYAGYIQYPEHFAPMDEIHPNDEGYARMATIWYEAIKDAIACGFLKPPLPSDRAGDDGVWMSLAPKGFDNPFRRLSYYTGFGGSTYWL
jgi:lysophospholipase L1-like esterase